MRIRQIGKYTIHIRPKVRPYGQPQYFVALGKGGKHVMEEFRRLASAIKWANDQRRETA